jgi:hypothetical protein
MEKIEKTLDDGRAIIEYENGAQKDAVTGLWIRPADKNVISDRGQAVALARRRWDQVFAAIDAGLAEVALDGLPASTIRRIVAARALVAIEDKGRAGNEAARLIFQVLGVLDKRSSAADSLPDDGMQIKIGKELARGIIEAIARVRAERINSEE